MNAVLNLILLVLQVFQFILLARVLLSWFPDIDRNNPLVKFLYDITEPVLQPVRELLPQTGMMDFSPLVVFVVILVLSRLIMIAA